MIDISKWEYNKTVKENAIIQGVSEHCLRKESNRLGLTYAKANIGSPTKFDINKWDVNKTRRENALIQGMSESSMSRLGNKFVLNNKLQGNRKYHKNMITRKIMKEVTNAKIKEDKDLSAHRKVLLDCDGFGDDFYS